MSIWSQTTGTIFGAKKNKISVDKLVKELFDGDDFSIYIDQKEQEDRLWLDFCIEESGDTAIKSFKKLQKALDNVNLNYDLELTVRFLK